MEVGDEGGRESPKQTALSAEPDIGLDLATLRSGLELKPRVRCSTNYATQVPQPPGDSDSYSLKLRT